MNARGFTLIELIVAVAIVGILSTIAIPSYQSYIVRSQLIEATNGLSDMRVRMEQFYADNRTYTGGAGCGVPAPALERFTLVCVPAGNGQGYTVTASGSGTVSGFSYTIDQANQRSTVSWGAGWGAVPAEGATRWLTRKG